MAFTSTERAKVAHYMGWPASLATQLETALARVESIPEREALVRAELARVDTCITEIDAMTTTTVKAVVVGSLKLAAAYQLGVLRSRARQAVVAMASALDLEPNRDVFTASWSPPQGEIYS